MLIILNWSVSILIYIWYLFSKSISLFSIWQILMVRPFSKKLTGIHWEVNHKSNYKYCHFFIPVRRWPFMPLAPYILISITFYNNTFFNVAELRRIIDKLFKPDLWKGCLSYHNAMCYKIWGSNAIVCQVQPFLFISKLSRSKYQWWWTISAT